jgi:hypothetical protein
MPDPETSRISSNMQPGMYRAGGVAALVMLGIMAIQIIVYVIWPPPTTVEGFFTLFASSKVLGLLSMDLLYLVNNTVLILIYLALFTALKPAGKTAMTISLLFGLVGICAYFASNTAFKMLSLSGQYAAATSENQKIVFMAAAESMLAVYRGTAFLVYYVLNAIALLILAAVMLRSHFFSRGTAIVGLIAGILMSVPSTAGTVGLIFALASLVPWGVFLVLIARAFFAAGREGTKATE